MQKMTFQQNCKMIHFKIFHQHLFTFSSCHLVQHDIIFLTIFPFAGTHAFLPQMSATAFNGWDQINLPICRRIGKLKKTYIGDQSMVHTSKLRCMKGTFIHWSDYTSEFWCMNHPRPMYEGFFIFNFPHYHPTPLSTQPNPIQQQFCCMFRQTNRQNFAKFCF